MKPNKINDILDIAFLAREAGNNFCPLFSGAPGIGKSQIVQKYAKDHGYQLIDCRIAYFEAPDMIGFPTVEKINGRQITIHNLPEFWPEGGKGVLLLEEPNRGTTSVMNTLMQLLTDRKVGKYTLPEGWIIAACINPETEAHDVNNMDAALKNRFAIFDVEFDKQEFVDYMTSNKWSQNIINFVSTGIWKFTPPERIGNGKFVSSRTFEQLNAAELAAARSGRVEDMMLTLSTSILGLNVGSSYYNFVYKDAPVTYHQLISEPASFKQLQKHCKEDKYQGDKVAITYKSIVEGMSEDVNVDFLIKVLHILPADVGYSLIKELATRNNEPKLHETIFTKDKALKKRFQDQLVSE